MQARLATDPEWNGGRYYETGGCKTVLAEILPEGSVTPPETNIVFVAVPDAWEVIERLRDESVLVTFVAGKVRMLTHVDVNASDIDVALDAWRRVVGS